MALSQSRPTPVATPTFDPTSRLRQLASDWGVNDGIPVSPPPASILATPSPRTPLSSPPLSPHTGPSSDEFLAEELLKRRRQLAQHDKPQPHIGLRRAFTTSGAKKGDWSTREIYDALESHVGNAGSPGVAAALIARMASTGGDLNDPQQKRMRTSLLLRKKSFETLDRSQILLKAIQNRQPDMLAVLIPYADPLTLDTALPIAIRSGHLVMTRMLLDRGARLTQTPAGLEAFRELCVMGGQAGLVDAMLQSAGRPPPPVLSQALVDATRKGCLETVVRLTRSAADADYHDAHALRAAIAQSRTDISLALLTATLPPSASSLNKAFAELFANSSILPAEKMALAESLLCAGASGDVVSSALADACRREFYEMVHLLISYGASVQFDDATVLKSAIAKGQSDLVCILLNDQASLSALYASECVECIPKRVPPADRYALLTALLRKGAKGPPIHECLIDAVDVGDFESVTLLTTPYFPTARLDGDGHRNLKKGPRAKVFDRHETASVNYKDGQAIDLAIKHRNTDMLRQLLSAKPSEETLAKVFPQIQRISPNDVRFQIGQCFLTSTGYTESAVSDALQQALNEDAAPRRDDRWINLLLQYNPDTNFNEGAGIRSAVEQCDIGLLESLLKSQPSPLVTAAAIPTAMAVTDRASRFRMISLLVDVGAETDRAVIAEAVISILQARPLDAKLLNLLLELGKADINHKQGAAVMLAADHPDPNVLKLVLQKGKASSGTLDEALRALAKMPVAPARTAKVETVLSLTSNTESLSDFFVHEVQLVLKSPPADASLLLASLPFLLSAGADVNTNLASAMCHAVAAGHAAIVDMCLAAKPNATSLALALPHALHIADPMDRLSLTQKILEAGVLPSEANRALLYTINYVPDDVPLINSLAKVADSRNGEALVSAAKQGRPDLLGLLLAVTPPQSLVSTALDDAFVAAVGGQDAGTRRATCGELLKAGGVSALALSDALIVAARERDLEFCASLLERGACLEHKEGQAIVEACSAGAVAVARLLVDQCKKPELESMTATRAFDASAKIDDPRLRGHLFRLLLEKADGGVPQAALDAQLASAVRYGEEEAVLVELLMSHGADVNHNDGEAVSTATRSAFMPSLRLMLGQAGLAPRVKPNQSTLVRALKATGRLSRAHRYQAVQWLFDAGLTTCDEVDEAMNKAVNDFYDDADLKLIRLFLAYGASPTANNLQSLVSAAQKQLINVMAVFLEKKAVCQEDVLSRVFEQTFSPEKTDQWMAGRGLDMARMLLDRGAAGEGTVATLGAAIQAHCSDKDAHARQFVQLLLDHGVDISARDGLALKKAIERGDSQLTRQLLAHKATSRALSASVYHILEAKNLSEADTLSLLATLADYETGDERLDVLFVLPGSRPAVFQAVEKFPRSTRVLEALLNTGYYHDHTTMVRVMDEVDEDEQVTLLFWALLQPQKKVSTSIIELLVARGAKVNFQTRLSLTTPLMLAIQSKRPDVVKTLILEGADVDVNDVTGNTPLTMATRVGGDVGTSMLTRVLAADPAKNDGSLHNAARELDLETVKVLVEFGHEIDFPSPLHDGRSALGELCLHTATSETEDARRERRMEKTMGYLIDHGADVSVQCGGKSVLLLALHSRDPLATTRALLRMGMWKHINKPYNLYSDSRHTYSPTQYVQRRMPPSATHEQLLCLLKANRCIDVYYAHEGPQPDDATGLPDELLRAERERKARQECLASEADDHARLVQRTTELARIQDTILTARAELEDVRRRKQMDETISGLRHKSAVEEELFTAELRRRQAERDARLQHEQALMEAQVTRTRQLAEAALDLETAKHVRLLEWEQTVGQERVDHAKALSAVRVREREEIERLDKASDARLTQRMSMQRRLLEGQDKLANALANSGLGGRARRQVGYITGELD